MKKEMILTLLALLSIILISPNFLSCGKMTDTGHPIYSITGIIRNKVTNQPIDSAWIYAHSPYNNNPLTEYTDSTGEYKLVFYIASDNRQRIMAGKDGYETLDTIINVSIPQKIVDTINIYLEPE